MTGNIFDIDGMGKPSRKCLHHQRKKRNQGETFWQWRNQRTDWS